MNLCTITEHEGFMRDLNQLALNTVSVVDGATPPDSMMFTDSEGNVYVTGAFSPDGEPRILRPSR